MKRSSHDLPLRVAVLGAGIMGVCTALYLARRGAAVTLIDEAPAPLTGASRWNEGKIHLGYLYAADPTLETARRLLPGGLLFADAIQELTGLALSAETTHHEDLYLIHRDSVVSPSAAERYYDDVSALVRRHADARRYLVDTAHADAVALTASELARVADSRHIVAGYRVPERSVRTAVVADALVAALDREARVSTVLATRVSGVTSENGDARCWRVVSSPKTPDRFDVVVNALWQGRLGVDGSAGLARDTVWTHRYRVALFIETTRPLDFPSVVVATGPFGDIRNYDRTHFYVSWYHAGLLVESHEVIPKSPEPIHGPRRNAIVDAVRASIVAVLPGAAAIFESARHVAVKGGWVYAQGEGSLGDPSASLHRRDRFGVRRMGSYLSVDTGKFSTAPWLAAKLAAEIMDGDVQSDT